LGAAEADDRRLVEEVDPAGALDLDVLHQAVAAERDVEDGVAVATSVDLPGGVALAERLVRIPISGPGLVPPVEERRVLPLPGVEEGPLALVDLQVIVRSGADDLVQCGAAGHQLGERGEAGLAAAALLAFLTRLAGIDAQPVGVALQRRALALVPH